MWFWLVAIYILICAIAYGFVSYEWHPKSTPSNQRKKKDEETNGREQSSSKS